MSEGRNKGWLGEEGAGSSPAGGDALASPSQSRGPLGDAEPCDQPAAAAQTSSPRARLHSPKRE